jgi:hypothetical protein
VKCKKGGKENTRRNVVHHSFYCSINKFKISNFGNCEILILASVQDVNLHA